MMLSLLHAAFTLLLADFATADHCLLFCHCLTLHSYPLLLLLHFHPPLLLLHSHPLLLLLSLPLLLLLSLPLLMLCFNAASSFTNSDDVFDAADAVFFIAAFDAAAVSFASYSSSVAGAFTFSLPTQHHSSQQLPGGFPELMRIQIL